MPRTIGIGHQDFEKIRMKDNFYVDKTSFIREWWERDDDVTLITRPRRFGKTLTMSMLEKFFSADYAGREDLFQGLEIWTDAKYRELQGTYPVVSLSFAEVKAASFVDARKLICYNVERVYNKHSFLLKGNLLNEKEKAFFQSVSADMENYAAITALRTLAEYLHRYYGKNVIILLDEYDTPMQEAYVYGYWEELAEFTRILFNSAFKTNPYLERAVLTGITLVTNLQSRLIACSPTFRKANFYAGDTNCKESIFSDLNHMEVVTTTSNKYQDAFGFTEKEVFAALDEFGLSDKKQQVKAWYDGFTFGEVEDIYNPWSIINYLDKKKLAPYWVNTSSNSLVGKLIQEGNKNVKQEFETLLRGGTVSTTIDEQIVYHQLLIQKGAIWSFLLAGGYLKVVHMELEERTGAFHYQFSLTNKEVRIMFENMIRSWFEGSDDYYNDFIKALLQNDVKAMNHYMNKVALATFSYFDTGKNPSEEEPERFYHGFVLGLMVDLADRYVIISNRESGFGRYDVLLEPRNWEDDAMILEFKIQDVMEEKELSDTVTAALQQIEDRNYEAILIAKGIPKEHIRKYGFAFRGKKVLIGEKEGYKPI